MMVLPSRPSPVLLRSFWLVVSLGMGTVAVVWLALTVSLSAGALAGAAATGSALLGWLRPGVAAAPYQVWNNTARTYTRFVRLSTLLVMFYVVFAAVGLAGSRMALRPAQRGPGSMWVPLMNIRSDAEEVQPRRAWFVEFVAWARTSGNWWVLPCVPFFALLSLLGDRNEAERSFPSSIYTLDLEFSWRLPDSRLR